MGLCLFADGEEGGWAGLTEGKLESPIAMRKVVPK